MRYASVGVVSVHQCEHSMLLQQLKCFRSVLPLLLLLLSGVCSYPAGSSRLRCYVCGGENEEPCGDISETPPDTSLKTCPEKAQGCLTQVEDKEVSRSCVDLKIVDCKTANGKLYCYCDSDACNNKPAGISHTEMDDDLVPQHQIRNLTNGWQRDIENLEKMRSCDEDDEDRCDGSGSQPEDRSNDHLVDAIFNAGSTSTTSTTSSTTTREDSTTRSPVTVERTTKNSSVTPSDGTSFDKATSSTPLLKSEPGRGCFFKSTQPLLVTALVAVLSGNVLRTKLSLF